MPVNLKGRNFLKELDFTPEEFKFLLWLSKELKAAKYAGYEQPRMTGKNIALIFEKTSTRTRCAFEVAAYDQGAHVTYLGPEGSQIGKKESMKDTARVLGRMFDAIEYRGNAQAVVEVLGQVRRGAGLQRPDRRIPSHADAGRHPDDDGAHRQAAVASDLCLHGRWPLQHGALVSGDRRAAGHGCAHRRAEASVAGRSVDQ